MSDGAPGAAPGRTPNASGRAGARNVLGVLVDPVDYGAAVARVVAAAAAGEPLAVTALAVHGVMTGVLDDEHRFRLNRMDLVVPDGQPVRWALNLLHRAGLAERVYGPTLMLAVCEAAAARGLPVYFYGSRPAVLGALVERLRARFPGLAVAGAEPSAFRTLGEGERDAVVARVRASGARLVFVGLGCPRQEVWAYEYRERLGMPLLAVGAAFDFHAGLLPQAPARLQRAGLEWAFRLWQEPRRLWRRYAYLNPLYLGHLALQASGARRYDPSTARPPRAQAHFG